MSGPRAPGRIAVVGLACWYPGARDPRELWENVLAKRQEFRLFLEERMPAADYHDADPDAPDRTYGTRGAFIDGFRFDAGSWRVPQSTFRSTDISHWLALEVAGRALHDAGYPKGEGLTRDRAGVVVGNSLTGEQTRANGLRLRWPFVRRVVEREARRHLPPERALELVEAVGERYREHFPATNEDTLAGALSNTIAGRICGHFDLGGGGYVVDGACASSLLAVCTAASALEEGRVDVCVAGGVDISMDPFELVGFAKARALSPNEMRVYDRRGNGFIPGEGCGFVVLERLEDARARGARVYAVLEGWGVSSDGRNAITAPKVAGQARAIRAAWSRAGQPDFVEGHGTGTALGDKVELSAIAEVAGEASRAVGVTSLKSILGHTKAAAGVGAFLKAVVAVNRRVLPPTTGCAEPNPVFDEAAGALYPMRRGELRDPGSVLRAGASAMGFGGINTHVVVRSADAPDPSLAPAIPEGALIASGQETELFVFGAASLDALRGQLRALRPVAARISRGELVDLSADLLTRLPPSPRVRAAILAGSPAELVARIDRLLTLERADGPELWLDRPLGAPRIGFLCPGQGSQELDSGRTLLARDPELAAEARRLAEVAAAEGGPDLLGALYPDLDRAVTAAELAPLRHRLSATELAQPALCLVTLLWARRLAQLGIEPQVVAGHSLGELSAFALAGAIDADTLMRLAVHRGRAMAAEAGRPGAMVSLGGDLEAAEALCAAVPGYVAVANVNGPRQVVLALEQEALEPLMAEAARRGLSARRLPVSNGFHSALVADAAARLEAHAPLPARPAPPRAALLSTLTPEPVSADLDLRAHVGAHVRERVDFVRLVHRVTAQADLLVEVGSGRVLSGLVDAIQEARGAAGPRCLPVEGSPGRAADLQTVLAAAWIRGADPRWSALCEGRLVRPFVAPAERIFIANPCELGREAAEELVEPAALPSSAPAPTPTPTPTPAPAPAPARPPEPPLAAAPALGSDAILQWLFARVAERTGFDPATLSPDQRLQDDLNLDSIKAGELVAAAARHVGVASRVDPAQYLRQPLSAIARALGEIRQVSGPAEPPAPRAAQAPVTPAPAQAPTEAQPLARWVRAFGLSALPSPAPTSSDWRGARLRLLASAALRPRLERALVGSGATLDAHGEDLIAVLEGADTRAQVHELRALVSALGARSLLLVTRLDGRFGLEDPGSGPAGAAFARAISLERPSLAVRALDAASTLDEEALIAAILASRPSEPGLVNTSHDGSGWWTLGVSPLIPSRARPRPEAPRRGELVLVTGGARGITAECAEALARDRGVRLALLGSTPRDRVDDEILRRLGRLALDGIEARYWACDLADPEAVARTVAEIRMSQGPIAALVHGAGRNTPRRVEAVSEEEALHEIAPKLLGAEALLAALEDAPPRLVVALTSIIGVTGMHGNAWYAYANEALDLAIARFARRHPGTAALSLAYGVWSEVGMGARMGSVHGLARMGIGALEPAEGVRRFLAMIAQDPGVRQPIVSAHVDGLPTWPARLPEDPSLRFLDGARAGVPGVEARIRLELRPDRDTWLRDHDFKGSLLLPTVFGLEAMAQAAWLARGGAPGEVVAFEQVELPAPVVVPEEGARVELLARVHEEDPDAVACEVRVEQTGFARAHFAATVRFGTPLAGEPATLPNLPAPEPPLLPARDLYGGLLFQGRAFHRMGPVRGGRGREIVFDGEIRRPEEGRWLAGDPFFRDALLQAGQVLVAQDDALPVRIRRITLSLGHADPGARAVHASILSSQASSHTGAVEVLDAEGRRSQRLEGYEVHVLAHHPDRPETEAILRPRGEAGARLVERLLAELEARGLPRPLLGLFPVEMHGLPVERRRALARELLATLDTQARPRWSEEGRPSLEDGRGLSIAHDAGACLLLVAPGAVGCDVEPVAPREDWPGLLGAARARLLPALRHHEDLHSAGTRIWVAGEALHKAGAGDAAPEIVARAGDLVELRLGAWRALTLALALERGPRRMVALAFGPAERQDVRPPAASAPSTPAAGDRAFPLDPTLLSVRMQRGSSDRMETRFVVAFDEASSLSGRVGAVTLATWMGRLRELALASQRAAVLEALGSGRHGMVTQSAWTRLSGEASALDRVEATTWVEELRPTTCQIRFAFERVSESGERSPIGEAGQRFGWVEVRGHGVVQAAPFPTFFQDFLARLGREDASGASPLPLLLPHEPAVGSATIHTTQVDSNVVGNLYYAHYFKWAQTVVDRLVWRHAPDVLRARGELGELALSAMRLEYMREAMPFDTVEVSLHPAPAEHGGLTFDVLFQRPEPDGTRTRLALGRLEGAWSLRTANGRLASEPPPWARHTPVLEMVT